MMHIIMIVEVIVICILIASVIYSALSLKKQKDAFSTLKTSTFSDSNTKNIVNTTVGAPVLNQIGAITSFISNTSVPTGWLLCDGSKYQISQYPVLAQILGSAFASQSSNANTFNVPDLQGKFVVGYNPYGNTASTIAQNNLFAVGGTSQHTITTGNLPLHTHSISISATDLSHQHNYVDAEFASIDIGGGASIPTPMIALTRSQDNHPSGAALLWRGEGNDMNNFAGAAYNYPQLTWQPQAIRTSDATVSLNHTHSLTISNAGGNTTTTATDPISIMPPFYVLVYIIRAL